MKKRTIYITLFLIFIIGVISLIGTFAIDSTITEGNSTKADYLFNITLGDRTNREIVIPSYDSKIVDIKISNPNEFNMSYLLYLEGVNSNLSIINISDNESSGVLNSKTNTLIKVFIQNNSSSDITTSIKDIVGFEKEKLSVPSNNTSINKGTYYKVIVKSNDNTYGKVKPNIKLSTNKGTVKYTLVPNTGYQYKSTTCNGAVSNNILTISNITSNTTCEVVFEPIQVTVNFDLAGGGVEIAVYTELKEHTYITPYTGTYKLETWGAQGGSVTYSGATYRGGYGSYSTGIVSLNAGDILYANVGGSGSGGISSSTFAGGYNGGGAISTTDGTTDHYHASGGGATHIAIKSGLLSTLSGNLDSILIVSGGGGGGYRHTAGTGYSSIGGEGGGIAGTDSTTGGSNGRQGLGGIQTTGGKYSGSSETSSTVFGSFGQGGTPNASWGSAGGGGYYGGGASYGNTLAYGNSGGGGGSGYIGNSQLTDKYMYCYNCSTSDATDTKTYTTTCHSDSLTANCVKEGNGATRITLLSNFSHTKTYNTKYGTLPTPTKNGYTFGGWYTGENGTGTKVDENTVLINASDHTLYAKWDKNVVVTYNYRNNIYNQDTSTWIFSGNNSHVDNNYSYNGTTGLAVSSSDAYTGVAIPLNNDKKQNKNYILSARLYKTIDYNGYFGVYTATCDESGNVINWNHNIDVNANDLSLNTWKEYSYSFNSGTHSNWYNIALTFDTANQGPVYVSDIRLDEYESKSIQRGEKYGTMPTPTRSGYTFAGWYTETDGGGTRVTNDTVLTNTSDHTLYAKWKINNITVTYDGNIFTPSINYKVDNGLTITYDPNTSYLTINGTPTTSGQSLGIMYNLSFTEGEKYASKVTYISGSYNNTDSDFGCFALDVKNSNGVGVSTRNYADLRLTTSSAETILTINSAGASEGDRFQYWLYLNDSSKWTFTNYTVKLDLSKIESKTILHGQKYGTMPTPIRTGYTFEGWYTGENGTGTKITSDTVLTNKNNHTLYANWTVNSYYLDLNGMLNGNSSGYLTGYGIADVYINGILVCNDCDDYYSEHPYGTAYSISDIKTTAGHTYNGVYSGSASGTITGTTAVYLNFSTSDTSAPTCSLSASGSNITASASDNVGLSYQGWDSSYSGTSITSKDISAGTHTYYVKDTAGNTNTCSISISGLVEKDIPYTETSAAYANYTTVYSGSCRCSKKATGGTSYVEGYCNPSSGCSCPGGTSISSNSCIGTKKVTSYYCPGNGKVSGSTCIYTKYKITYVCPDGYSGVSGNSNYCYKY